MRVLVVVAMVACGPTVTSTPKQSAREALAGDVARYEELVSGGVTNGGLWFEDPACAAKFGKPGVVPKAELAAFARCLVLLHLQPSTREDALGDVVVMTYGPFEIEARVVPDRAGPRLTWIGYEAQASDSDRLPTVSAQALEALRVEGAPDGPLDPAVAAALELDVVPRVHAAFTWIKFCVDDYGAVTSAVPYETTSVRARDAAVLAVLAWRFKPVMLGGQATPVCSLARLVYPAGVLLGETIPLPPPPSRRAKPTLVLAAETKVLGKHIGGTAYIRPSPDVVSAMRNEGRHSISARFRICIDERGHVESALPLRSTGYAAYDRQLVVQMMGWVYAPYIVDGSAEPVCAPWHLEYYQSEGTATYRQVNKMRPP